MNRREFLRFAGLGAASVALVEPLGFFEHIRSYFFAPVGGWAHQYLDFAPVGGWAHQYLDSIALQLQMVSGVIPQLFENDAMLTAAMLRDFNDTVSTRYMRFPMPEFIRERSYAEVNWDRAVLIDG